MARIFALSFAVILTPVVAAAATLDFRRIDGPGWSSQSTFGELTVQAGTETGGQIETGAATVAAMRYIGLGIQNSGDQVTQIDSLGENDVVIFRFDRPVVLERIAFSGTEWWDRFDLYSGEDLSYDRTLKVDDLSGYDWVSSIGLGNSYVGTTFAIGASEYTSCGYSIAEGHGCWVEDSAFHITSITFSDVQPVPLPSSVLLLLSAVMAAGYVSGRKRSG